MTFGPGSIVAGRYHADRLVGTGGMGEVWAGEHVTVGNKVALKRLLPAAAQHHEVVTRFRREAVLLGKIRSDHVARVVDFIDDREFGPVLVMEFIEGPSLAQILEDRAISVEEAVELASDLAVALCDLHDAKIVHRDLKPGNIIMQPQPNGRSRAVIVDFGIGRQLSSGKGPDEVTGLTRANIALGTVEYMAPEQILNSRDVTPLSDIYAVGAILYRSVAGVHAFGARRGEELARAKLIDEAPRLNVGRSDEAARALSDLVARCLKKRPANRFGSAAELRAAVDVILERIRIDELDLDSTTAETHLFQVAKEAPPPTPLLPQAPPQPIPARASHPPPPRPSVAERRPSLPSISEAGPPPSNVRGSLPSISEAPAVRPSMPSISDVGLGPQAARGSMPSISDGRVSMPAAPPSGRGSLPSIPDFGGEPVAGARVAPASIGVVPEAPRAPGSLAPPGIGQKTVALAVLTAFAVGAAVGLVVAPTSTPPKAAAAPSTASTTCTCPAPSASPAPSSASTAGSAPSASAAGPSASAAPIESASEIADASAPAKSTEGLGGGARPKPSLSGRLPDSTWTPPTAQVTTPSAPPSPVTSATAPPSAPKPPPSPPPSTPDDAPHAPVDTGGN